MTGEYQLDYSIIKIGQYTEKRPGDTRRLRNSNSSERPITNAGMKNS